MISGATNKFSLYSQPRHFANGFQSPSPWPPRLFARARGPFEKVPTPGNHFAFRVGSGRPTVTFMQVATSVYEERSRVHAARGNFFGVTGSRTVAST